MVQQVANTSLDPPGLGSGRRGRTIDAKCFRAIAFGCDAREWGAWSFAFKRTVRSCSRDGFIMMDFVEKQSVEVQEHLLGGKGSGSVSPNVVSKLWAELHDVLRQVVSGEAMTILRSVEDCRGFVAWQKLYQKFNPKTVARAIRSLAEACSPAKVKELVDVDPAICVWEQKVALLSKEFQKQVSNNMKVAIVTSMLLPSIQDNVLYVLFISKIRADKVAMMTKPTPTDIGYATMDEVGGDCSEDDVQAVTANTRCEVAVVGDIFPASALPWAMGPPRRARGETRRARGRAKAAARLA